MNKTKITLLLTGALITTALLSSIAYGLLTKSSQKDIRESISHTENLYEKSKDSIVKLYTLGSQTHPAKSGTGFKTYFGDQKIITNKHIVENQTIVIAETPERTWIIQSWVEHPTLDIAILNIEGQENIETLEIDTNYIVRPGQKIYTLGYPLGLGLAIHEGLVSAIDKEKIVFSAPLSEGASGSPLINQEGRVIGICDSYIPNAQNYNLATPTSLAFLTKTWVEKRSETDPALDEYILKISSIRNRIFGKHKEWKLITLEHPEWKPWVEKTMVTRRPTDEAMGNALLAFAAVEWGSLVNETDKAYRIKEGKLLKDCTDNLKKIWDIHKDNLLSNRSLKPVSNSKFSFELVDTESMIKTMEDVSTELIKFLNLEGTKLSGNAQNCEKKLEAVNLKIEERPLNATESMSKTKNVKLHNLILAIGRFRVAEAKYHRTGTP